MGSGQYFVAAESKMDSTAASWGIKTLGVQQHDNKKKSVTTNYKPKKYNHWQTKSHEKVVGFLKSKKMDTIISKYQLFIRQRVRRVWSAFPPLIQIQCQIYQ